MLSTNVKEYLVTNVSGLLQRRETRFLKTSLTEVCNFDR